MASHLTITAAVLSLALLGMPAAQAADPAGCADRQVLSDLRLAYQSLAASMKGPALADIGTPVDAGLVDDAPALKKRPGSNVGKSRFCHAPLLLADGREDLVYYRIDALLDGAGQGNMLSPCFGALARSYASTVESICAPYMPRP